MSADTASTVTTLARDEAKRTTHLALWAVIAGSTPQHQHQQHRHENQQWRAALSGLGSTADAFR